VNCWQIVSCYPRNRTCNVAVLRLCYLGTAGYLILPAAGSSYSNAVDVYNRATGTWSTAQLSVARESLAATSVGALSLIAGGENTGTLLCKVFGSLMNTNALRVDCV